MPIIQDYVFQTFSSLKNKNYRLYIIGQAISTVGTFMQMIAQPWLVLQLTNSGTALGLVLALQYLPILLLSPWGGLLVDRYPKRKILFFTQIALGILSFALGILVATNTVQLWMVYALALGFGLVTMIDTPARQAFIVEMVGKEELKNAITFYNSLLNLARVIGPAIAGILISTVGIMLCFIINGITYAAVVIVLLMMNPKELLAAPPVKEAKGQIIKGFRYVYSSVVLMNTLIMLGIIGTLTYEFTVSLPLIAQFTFNGGAGAYAELTAALGLGSIIGGLFTASLKKTSNQTMVGAAFLFGLSIIVASFMPSLGLMMLAMLLVGAFSMVYATLATLTLQLESAPEMQGRVLALWSIAFLGSTTIGAPAIGWIGENIGPRWGLAVGGVAALIAGAIGFLAFRKDTETFATPEEAIVTSEEYVEEDRRLP